MNSGKVNECEEGTLPNAEGGRRVEEKSRLFIGQTDRMAKTVA